MPIKYSRNHAAMRDAVSCDEAEALLVWLQKKPNARVDMAACQHLHPANIQVLKAAGIRIAAWPQDRELCAWLKTILMSD